MILILCIVEFENKIITINMAILKLSKLTRKLFGFEQTYMYEILVTGPLCTSECAGEYCFSANLCKRALDVIVETTCNADILNMNASEDFQ